MIIDQKNYTLHNFGEKAKKLFIMRKNNLPVPFLICITGEIPQNLTEILLKEDKEAKWAVRSCYDGEDGKDYSFAGQFKTLLNVTAEDVPAAVKDCINSASAEDYRKNMNISAVGKISVIVQKMVNADISGVMFSINPLGILSEEVISVGKGIGAVVTDEHPVTTYYVSNIDNLYYYSQQKNAPLLSENHISSLTEACRRITKIFRNHMDIEYAFEGERLYILQCRPITAISNKSKTILDNSNISESYPGISLPLTISFVHDAYAGIFKGVALRCLKSERIVSRYSYLLENMTGSVNGRLYYKISNWYTVIKFLPFSKKIIPIWQEMMGVSAKEDSGSVSAISPFRRIFTYFNAVYEFIKVPSNMERLELQFNAISKDFHREFSSSCSPRQLISLYDKIAVEILSCWDVTLLNDMYAFIFTGLLKKKIGDENANKIISKIVDIESIKPIRALASLAIEAESDGHIKKLLELKSDDEAREYFSLDGKFFDGIREYINLYGDRAPEELKLETNTFRTSPLLLAKQICTYCSDKRIMRRLREIVNADDDIYYSQSFFARNAALGIKNRETSRLNRCRIYGMIREIFCALGDDFYSRDIIEKPEDIFMLTISEIRNIVGGDITSKHELISKRYELWNFYKKLPPYSRLIFSGKEFSKSSESESGISIDENNNDMIDMRMKGTPCSHGFVIGEALVIDGNPQTNYAGGKILVAKMTDPGWVFIMAGAKGIISEKGSLLSHTAIISRELGLPAVTGVKNAASLIETGDIITLNGSTGEIHVERINI